MRDEEFARLENEGLSPWVTEPDASVRTRIVANLELVDGWEQWSQRLPTQLSQLLRMLDGWDPQLADIQYLEADARSYTASQFWSVVEMIIAVAPDIAKGQAEDLVNRVLDQERLLFRMVEGKLIPRTSQELHAEVVEPTLRLLHRDGRFAAVEAAYQSALREIVVDPSDAITDAGTALQELLEELGFDGNSLGDLLKSAKKRGALARHDDKLIDWVAADRSTKGDAHHTSDATPEDAWLTVHVVGALILRLVGPARSDGDRGDSQA